jgi:hypothetical protein
VTTDDLVDPFFRELVPYANALRSLCTAAEAARLSDFLPAANSLAMQELLEEEDLSTENRKEPIRSVHAMGNILVTVAEDHMTSLLKLMHDDPVPAFGTQIITRALLEACGAAKWLLDIEISPRTRVARGWTETLYSWDQVRNLSTGHVALFDAKELRIRNAADSLGMTFHPKKKRDAAYVDSPKPGNTKTVVLALGPEIGKSAYNYLSAVAHGTSYGLMQQIQATGERAVDGDPLAAVGVSTRNVAYMWSLAALGYATAIDVQMQLFGWMTDEWITTRGNCLELFHGALKQPTT